jgi:hypothetical protein
MSHSGSGSEHKWVGGAKHQAAKGTSPVGFEPTLPKELPNMLVIQKEARIVHVIPIKRLNHSAFLQFPSTNILSEVKKS